MQKNIWFNKGLSNVFHALQLIRQGDVAGEFRLFCSHVHPHFAGFLLADVTALEPVGLSGFEYVEYCVEFCRSNNIAVFFPGKHTALIAHVQERFNDIGTVVVNVANQDTL